MITAIEAKANVEKRIAAEEEAKTAEAMAIIEDKISPMIMRESKVGETATKYQVSGVEDKAKRIAKILIEQGGFVVAVKGNWLNISWGD